MERLRAIPGGLNVDTLLSMPEADIGSIIHPVGFYKTKAKSIKATCSILKEKFNSDIPETVEGLLSLPGVGPKMAHLCMQSAWGIVSGIGETKYVILGLFFGVSTGPSSFTCLKALPTTYDHLYPLLHCGVGIVFQC